LVERGWLCERYSLLSIKFLENKFEQVWENSLICAWLRWDEVESLAAARTSALGGSEPSDSIRVVNALLTQLDQLKNHENVIILTTSNITEAMGNNFFFSFQPSKINLFQG